MAITSLQITRTRDPLIFNVSVDDDGTMYSFKWNKNTEIAGLKQKFLELKAKALEVDTEIEDLKAQVLSELSK